MAGQISLKSRADYSSLVERTDLGFSLSRGDRLPLFAYRDRIYPPGPSEMMKDMKRMHFEDSEEGDVSTAKKQRVIPSLQHMVAVI